jgi:hypothetical protein
MKNWLRERSPRGYMLRSRVRVRGSTHEQGPQRTVSLLQLPPSRAGRAVNRRVAAVPKIEAIEGSTSRIGPNPSLPEAPEELIVAVANSESTRRAQGVTLEAERTKAKSWFSVVSHAFVLSRQEETKTGVEHHNSPLPSRKTRRRRSLPILLIDGAEVRARHSTHRRLRSCCCIGVRFVDRIDRTRQRTFGVW